MIYGKINNNSVAAAGRQPYLFAIRDREPPVDSTVVTPSDSRAATGSHAFYAYSTNCLIDLQPGIIVDVEDLGQSNERGELDQDDD
ncbi:hypothetical protein RM96_31805 [Cupriavidus sp. IDO]|nr:hypothetical protein RM96_31805 [Cupriavidus sp. IDO]